MGEKAQRCIDSHAKQALVVSYIPLVSLPIVYGVCAKMIVKLDKIFGIPTAKGLGSEILQDVMVGVIVAPALAIPILGASVATFYIKSIGRNYTSAVTAVINTDPIHKLCDSAFAAKRIREELQKIHASQRKEQL